MENGLKQSTAVLEAARELGGCQQESKQKIRTSFKIEAMERFRQVGDIWQGICDLVDCVGQGKRIRMGQG